MNRSTPVGIVLILLSPLTQAADAEHGKTLHQTHCTSCHIGMTGGDGSPLYTRKDRRVNSLQGLKKQVRRCETTLELKWFDDDVADVVEYLNTQYYKFPSP
jgi:mono/diheme cytochrome c family protein